MHKTVWVLQIAFGVYFIGVGMIHFILPDNLPTPMEWMYELSTGLHYVSGTLEILGGLGLILPGLVKVQTRLTPLAAAGLALVMVSAAIWHAQQSQWGNIPQNIVIAGIVGFIAYARWRLYPIS